MTVLSCEGSTSKYVAMKPQASIDNVANYVNGGGRLFVSHLHFYWLVNRPADLATSATPYDEMDQLGDNIVLTVNQTFPKGRALAQWLNTSGGEREPDARAAHGERLRALRQHRQRARPASGCTSPSPRSSQYLSFNTPVGTPEEMQCGKVVFTDIHIQKSVGSTGGDDSDPGKPFPSGCKTNEMSPQAKALEFLFFDLSACVLPDDDIARAAARAAARRARHAAAADPGAAARPARDAADVHAAAAARAAAAAAAAPAADSVIRRHSNSNPSLSVMGSVCHRSREM